MDASRAKANQDTASYGAEALPAGFAEMRRAMGGAQDTAPRAGASGTGDARLVGLIALAAHWIKKRRSGD